MKKINVTRFLFNALVVFLMAVYFLGVPGTSHAAGATDKVLKVTLENPIKASTFQAFINSVLTGVMILLTPVIVLMFIWTGFLFVKAQGNAEDLTTAKKSLMFTIIGAALVLGAKGLSSVLLATFKDL